ncbi:MAG: plastocyanin/azurin family copper-binding protein [Solirubrobacterales bacterium]
MRFKTAARARSQLFPRVSVLALAAGLIALAGCGSSSGTTSSSGSTPATSSSAAASTPAAATGSAAGSLSLAANAQGELKYNTTSLTAKAGDVSIAFMNSSSLSHNVTIASASGAVLGATPTFSGGSKTLSLNLKPGTYKFYCSVPGHRQAGMEGTLTVQ